MVPTLLSGPSGDSIVRLALDTGATDSMVNWGVLVSLGYNPANTSTLIQMTTGSGIEFVPQIPVEGIEALGQWRGNFPVLCHTLPPSASVDGVLGLDFLRGLRLIVDFREGLVTLE